MQEEAAGAHSHESMERWVWSLLDYFHGWIDIILACFPGNKNQCFTAFTRTQIDNCTIIILLLLWTLRQIIFFNFSLASFPHHSPHPRCPSRRKDSVLMSWYFVFTSDTITIFKPWLSSDADINMILVRSESYTLLRNILWLEVLKKKSRIKWFHSKRL